ncbi:hypothetical protein AB0H36_03760 [Kribbella sp. NPDC050820]|uniref:hypothetical protein n=1 Tax=Kribbella sp. NPDC050820 TaxID=3155408 RepID=UPI0033C24506
MYRSDRGRFLWWWCLCLATLTGLLCMIAKWGPAGAFVCVLLAALSAVVVASAVWSGNDSRQGVKGIGRAMLASMVLGPAAIGLIGAFGFGGVLIVLTLTVTAPALVELVRARWFTAKDPAPQDLPEVGFLSDEELCLAWRRSFLLLEAARSAQARLTVVEERQRYLDELYRRSPDGVAAWLAAGALASGNPLPYVGDDDDRHTD